MHASRLRQLHRRKLTYLPTFNAYWSPSMVVVISGAHLPTGHSLFHAHVLLSAAVAKPRVWKSSPTDGQFRQHLTKMF